MIIFYTVQDMINNYTKNISFLIDKHDRWKLSPAYDVIYSHNPDDEWTSRQQMSKCESTEGARDSSGRKRIARRFHLGGKATVDDTLDEIDEIIKHLPQFAVQSGVPDKTISAIAAGHQFFSLNAILTLRSDLG
jgi:serine/threonine-protein kinase HipA